MNITSWDVYWITRLDAIKDCTLGIIIVLSVILIFLFFALVGEGITKDTPEEGYAHFRLAKYCALSLFVPVFLAIVYPFIPTTKEACMMYAVPKLANSECVKTLQGDAKELYTLGIERLKAELAVKGGKDGTK